MGRLPTVTTSTSTNALGSAFDWMFRSRETGRITIAQLPNPPLGIFLGSVVLRWVVPAGPARVAVNWVGALALAWWAIDEIVRGVNPWRRLLGAAGLVAAAGTLVALAF